MEQFFSLECQNCETPLLVSNGDPSSDPYGIDVGAVRCPNCNRVTALPEWDYEEPVLVEMEKECNYFVNDGKVFS